MDLKKILDEHLLWLNGEGGKRKNICPYYQGKELICQC